MAFLHLRNDSIRSIGLGSERLAPKRVAHLDHTRLSRNPELRRPGRKTGSRLLHLHRNLFVHGVHQFTASHLLPIFSAQP
jgi:hypothetical protein